MYLRTVVGIESVSSILKTCSSYTCTEYSDMTHNTLLTRICGKLLTQTNILFSHQPPLNISNSSLVLLLVLLELLALTHAVQSLMYLQISSRT